MSAPTPPHRILLLFAHPAFQRSRVHRRLVATTRDLEGVTLHDLYEDYPDFGIDVSREKQLLLEHDTIVFQHPFYWYSTPAILKEWQDLVLEHGWAFGHGGTALHGKRALSAVTTGAPESAYSSEGANRFSMTQLLAPIEQTWALCGVEWLPPFLVHGTHSITPAEVVAHTVSWRETLIALRDGTLDLDAARRRSRMNLPARESRHAR